MNCKLKTEQLKPKLLRETTQNIGAFRPFFLPSNKIIE